MVKSLKNTEYPVLWHTAKIHNLPCGRMKKSQAISRKSDIAGISLRFDKSRIVFSVSPQGKAMPGHLHPDLMMAAGHQMNLCQRKNISRIRFPAFQNLILKLRPLSAAYPLINNP